jgi:hypothetical protein
MNLQSEQFGSFRYLPKKEKPIVDQLVDVTLYSFKKINPLEETYDEEVCAEEMTALVINFLEQKKTRFKRKNGKELYFNTLYTKRSKVYPQVQISIKVDVNSAENFKNKHSKFIGDCNSPYSQDRLIDPNIMGTCFQNLESPLEGFIKRKAALIMVKTSWSLFGFRCSNWEVLHALLHEFYHLFSYITLSSEPVDTNFFRGVLRDTLNNYFVFED